MRVSEGPQKGPSKKKPSVTEPVVLETPIEQFALVCITWKDAWTHFSTISVHEAVEKSRTMPALRKTVGWLIDFTDDQVTVASTDDRDFDPDEPDEVSELTQVPYGMIVELIVYKVADVFKGGPLRGELTALMEEAEAPAKPKPPARRRPVRK